MFRSHIILCLLMFCHKRQESLGAQFVSKKSWVNIRFVFVRSMLNLKVIAVKKKEKKKEDKGQISYSDCFDFIVIVAVGFCKV